MPDIELGNCNCCNREPAIGVASIPWVPMSIAWCKNCLDARIFPMWCAVGLTVDCGGWDNMDPQAVGWIKRTIAYFEVSQEDFDRDVAKMIAQEDKDMQAMAVYDGMREEFAELIDAHDWPPAFMGSVLCNRCGYALTNTGVAMSLREQVSRIPRECVPLDVGT